MWLRDYHVKNACFEEAVARRDCLQRHLTAHRPLLLGHAHQSKTSFAYQEAVRRLTHVLGRAVWAIPPTGRVVMNSSFTRGLSKPADRPATTRQRSSIAQFR
jgi:hypothetical protein